MKKRLLFPSLVLASLGVALVSLPSPVLAQDDYHGGSIEARKHGYEHGYRDGYQYGRDVKSRGVALDIRTDSFREADMGYRPFMGPREEYRDGYREGYRNGAEDGYQNVQTRLEQTYGYHDRSFDPDRVREDRVVTIYRERSWEYQEVAADVGYRDGVNAGLKDFREHHSFRPQEHDAWKEADHGYDKAFGPKDEFKRAYRVAYERGYRDGFGMRP